MLIDIRPLYLRKLYFVWVSLFLFLLYPLRYLTLSMVETSFVFEKQGFAVSWAKVNPIELVVFSVIVILLGFLLPNKLKFSMKTCHLSLLRWIFYVQVLLILFLSVVLGAKMGTEQTVAHKLVFFLVNSLIPFDMLFLGLILFLKNKREVVFICLIFIFLAILKGSKSSLFFLLMTLYSVHILKGGSIFNRKYFLYGLVVILLFPIFSTIGNFIRASGEGVDITTTSRFFLINMDVVKLAFVAVSRRISGIDTLMLDPVLNNTVFSNYSILLYYVKGFIPAFIVDSFMGNQSVGIGRLFAIEFLGQAPTVANAYGVSLFGVIHYANNRAFVGILYFISIAAFFCVIRTYKNKWIISFSAIYFVHEMPILLMSGYPLKITIFYRYILFLALFAGINLLLRRFFGKGKQQVLRDKDETQ